MGLLQRSPLTITRDDGGGYWDSQGRWVNGSTSTLSIACTIQPYQKANIHVLLPEGIRSEDARVIRTKTFIKTSNEFTKQYADKTVIDGLDFYAFSIMPWSYSNLSTKHYEVIFVRDSQDTGGSL